MECKFPSFLLFFLYCVVTIFFCGDIVEFINEKEYDRLFRKNIDDSVLWDLNEKVIIDSFVNSIFEVNKFLHDIFFLQDYTILKYDFNTSSINFDHYKSIQLKSYVSNISDFETVTGIVNFTYVSWDEIYDYILDIPENWSLFIINPILMKYESGSIGIFLTPKYNNNFFIEECNYLIKSRTGYSLFLDYTNNSGIPKIIFDKPILSLESYLKEMKKTANKGLSKLLDFWAENDCVKVNSFEHGFDDYKDNLYYLTWEDIDLKNITSSVSFEIVHEKTGKSLGCFKRFNLDKTFNLAVTDKGVLKLSKSDLKDLLDGNFDFKLIN